MNIASTVGIDANNASSILLPTGWFAWGAKPVIDIGPSRHIESPLVRQRAPRRVEGVRRLVKGDRGCLVRNDAHGKAFESSRSFAPHTSLLPVMAMPNNFDRTGTIHELYNEEDRHCWKGEDAFKHRKWSHMLGPFLPISTKQPSRSTRTCSAEVS